MAIYSVLEPPPDRATKQEDAVVLRDRFSFLAFVAPIFWFLWHRMWLEAAVIFVIQLAVGFLNFAMAGELSAILMFVVSLFVGMEARNLRLAALRRRGWQDWGAVVAPNFRQAELQYVTEALAYADAAIGNAKTRFPVPMGAGLIDHPQRG